jgi:hypothetical protein
MVPADKLASAYRERPAEAAGTTDAELTARRDDVIERFALLQADLGGLYYEMAIRDAVNPEILHGRVAALSRLDAELAQIDRVLRGEGGGMACPSCGALAGRADAFCSQCAAPLRPQLNGVPR